MKVAARGNKRAVWDGLAQRTPGGLTKSQLIKNSKGKVVSKKQHELGKKNSERLRGFRYKKKDAKKPPKSDS